MDFFKWFQVEFPLYLKPQLDHGAGAISTCVEILESAGKRDNSQPRTS